MSDESVVGIVAVACLFGLPILWGIAHSLAGEWRKVRVAEQNAVLKKEMIERGFSPGEIVRVIEAGPDVADRIAGNLLATRRAR